MAQALSSRVQALSDEKQQLELILAAMGQGVMVLDHDGRITLANSSLLRVLDTDRNVSGKTPLEVFRRPELENAVKAVLRGKPIETLEITVGKNRILQANVAPVTNAAGIRTSAVVVFNDMTEIRLAERMRRDFVANVSHEFKTPLTSIRGYTETLLSGAKDDPKIASEFLRIIERNAQNLEELVSDLLVLAKLEAELPATREAFDLTFVIKEQIASRKNAIEDRGIQVRIDFHDSLAAVSCSCSASGNRTNDDKWLFSGCDRLGQRCVRRLVGKVLLTGEEAQKRTALKSAMISYGAAEHGITGLQRIEDRTLGDRSLDLEYEFGADVRQISEMIGKDQANHIKRASVPPPTALPASPGRSDSSYRPRRLSNKPVLRSFQNRYRTCPASLRPWRRAARSHSNPSAASLWSAPATHCRRCGCDIRSVFHRGRNARCHF